MSLEVHMGVVNSNIEQFNQFDQYNRQALKNRGHDIDKDDMVTPPAGLPCHTRQQVQ